jgi:hypothetical protein
MRKKKLMSVLVLVVFALLMSSPSQSQLTGEKAGGIADQWIEVDAWGASYQYTLTKCDPCGTIGALLWCNCVPALGRKFLGYENPPTKEIMN